MKKSSLIFFLIISIVFLTACSDKRQAVYMFSQIEECENISNIKYEKHILTVYSSNSDDEHLGGLIPLDYYAAKYESVQVNFEIFAYVFSSFDEAQGYFKNVTGKAMKIEQNYSIVRGTVHSRIVVIDGNKAYKVVCPKSEYDEMNTILSSIFSVKLF